MNVFRIQAMMTLGDFISGPLAAIRQSFRATGNDADSLAGRIKEFGKRAAPFAIAAGIIIGGMTATALATAETSKALGELGTLGAQDLEMFRAKAMQVSNEWAGVNAPGFISAAYDVKSALSSLSEQAQADITELAAVTSVATKASVEDMTSFIGKAFNIMGKSADFEGLSDTDIAAQLFAGMSSAVKEFMTTGPAMRQSLMSMGNAATIAGIGIKDQFVALGQLNNVMEASVAGTGFKTFANKLPEVAQELGLNFRNAAGEMLPLPDILDMITERVGGLGTDASQMKIISLFGTEAATAFNSLAENTDTLREKTIAVGSAMSTGREYMLEMAKTANDHLGANIQKMNQQLSNLIQIIGSLFVPIINTAVTFISWLAVGFQRIASVIAGNSILKWLSQMSAMLALVASLIGLFGALGAMLPGVIALVGTYASAMWTAATATLPITWPIYAVIAAIGLLVLAFKTNFMGIGDLLRGWYNTVRLVIDGVRAVFANLRGDTYTITGDLAEKLKASGLVGIVETIAGGLYRLWQILIGVGDVAAFAGKIVGAILYPSWRLLSSAVGMVTSGIRSLMITIMAIISPIIKLVGLINPNVWRVLGIVIGTVVVIPLMALLSLMSPVAVAIGLVVAAVWVAARTFQGWMMLINLVVQTVFDGWRKISNLNFGSIFGFIGGDIQLAVDYIKSFSLFDVGRNLWQTFVDGIKSIITVPVDTVKAGLQGIRNLLPFSDAKEGPLSALTLSGSRMMSTFAEGIDRAAPALRKSVGIALAGLIPMTTGADVSIPVQTEPMVITAPTPDITPADPVEMAAPAVAVAEAAPVELAALEVIQPAPVLPETQPVSIEAAEVMVATPVIEQTPPVMPAAQTVTVPSPDVVPAGAVVIPAATVETTAPEAVMPSPVDITAPTVAVAKAAPVELAAPEVIQPAAVVPETQPVSIEAAEVTVAAPVIEQTPPLTPAAQTVTVPSPDVVPAGAVVIPAAPVEMAAPEVVMPAPVDAAAPAVAVAEAAPVELAAPEVMQPAPVVPETQPVSIEAAEVTVAAPVIEQTPPFTLAAQTVTVPSPDVVPAEAVVIPAASAEMAAPEVVMPPPVSVAAPEVAVAAPLELDAPEAMTYTSDGYQAAETQLPEPVSRETIRERTVETVRRETNAGTRKYSITIQNLNLPNVADSRSFVDELTLYIDAHDGG